MRVAVLGSTGFSGSHISVELINRGHSVTGIARSADKLGQHDLYLPVKLDLAAASIADIVEVLEGHEVLVNAYNGPNSYKHFVETTRCIILASKGAKIDYFVMIGGTGSLHLPEDPYTTAADSREWWLAYRRAGADSEAATSFAEQRFPPMAENIRSYRDARIALLEGKATDEQLKVIHENDNRILQGDDWIPDLPVAARAAYMMFEGNASFKWTFVSPPAMYLAGPRTVKYDIWVDKVPMLDKAERQSLDGNQYEGRLLGVSAADLAVAVADEIEQKTRAGKHWSPVGQFEDGQKYPLMVTL